MPSSYPPLPPALPGARRELPSSAGRLSYYTTGPGDAAANPAASAANPSAANPGAPAANPSAANPGAANPGASAANPGADSGAPPLLLIHSVNAAASAYEVRPLYLHYAARQRVYAMDLPGFGFSERGRRRYTPRLMTDAVLAMARRIRSDADVPVDALALSLSAEFLARAAAEHPELFRSVALVSPTGMDGHALRRGPAGSSRAVPLVRDVVGFPLWGRALFNLLNSGPSARYFLEKTWGSKEIDEGLLRYDYLTSHQPGAEHAPFDFIGGYLFSNDIGTVYEQLALPVWMARGSRGDFVDYDAAVELRGRRNWTFESFPTGALPYFEQPEDFIRKYEIFRASPAAAAGRDGPQPR